MPEAFGEEACALVSEVTGDIKQLQMMMAEGDGGAVSPRSDLSESQLWEVIGAESASSDGHIMAPAGSSAGACCCLCAFMQLPGLAVTRSHL